MLVGPHHDPQVVEAVRAAGGTLVEGAADASVVVWLETDPAAFPPHLHDGVGWVQLPQAGVNRWLEAGVVDDRRVWTSAAGVFGAVVGERAVALLLAGVHRLPEHARSQEWRRLPGGSLAGGRVLVVGTGSIGRDVARRLPSFGAVPLGMNRAGAPVDGFDEVVAADGWPAVCRRVDHVVLAAPLTKETRGMLGRAALDALPGHAVVVNVARGELVDTDALVDALRHDRIAAACLDVTAPEPLPDGHPLWVDPRALITSHTANPQPGRTKLLAAHIGANVERWSRGDELVGVIEPGRGY